MGQLNLEVKHDAVRYNVHVFRFFLNSCILSVHENYIYEEKTIKCYAREKIKDFIGGSTYHTAIRKKLSPGIFCFRNVTLITTDVVTLITTDVFVVSKIAWFKQEFSVFGVHCIACILTFMFTL